MLLVENPPDSESTTSLSTISRQRKVAHSFTRCLIRVYNTSGNAPDGAATFLTTSLAVTLRKEGQVELLRRRLTDLARVDVAAAARTVSSQAPLSFKCRVPPDM